MRGRPGGQSVGAALADDASRLTPNLTARLAAVAPLVDAAILAASRRSQHSDDCARALGEVLRGQEKLRSLSLDANALSGPGLKSLAADFKGHPTLSELSLDNQCNGAMMPNDAARLIVEATEATPALIVLKLGHLRDSGLRYRLQTALSAHTELVRQKRHRISMGEEGGERKSGAILAQFCAIIL